MNPKTNIEPKINTMYHNCIIGLRNRKDGESSILKGEHVEVLFTILKVIILIDLTYFILVSPNWDESITNMLGK